MSEQPAVPRSFSRDQVRLKLNRLRSSQQRGMFGLAEVIALAASAFVLLLVIVAYVYFLVPARSRLSSLQLERSRLQEHLSREQNVVRQGQSTEATVQNIQQSMNIFETKRLAGRSEGRTELYNVINDLIRKDALRNTAGPTYTPLEASASNPVEGTAKSTNSKWQSVYPGIAISLTVEGQYQNLRRFVHDIEASKQFIIINGVELERATETNSALAAESAPAADSRGSLVSLRLEMSTYFQRRRGESGASDGTEH